MHCVSTVFLLFLTMDLRYIDIHTHSVCAAANVLSLRNIIVSKDDLPDTYCSVGIHPWYIDNERQQYVELEQYATEKQVLGIGECGLDKMVAIPWNKQVEVFEQQIALAEHLRKPLLIHCVRSYQEVFMLLDGVTVPVVFHGFNKKIELARQIIQKGYYLSLGASIFGGLLDEHIHQLPLNKIFLETDDKPIEIMDVYMYFCAVRKMPLSELQEELAANFERVFKYSVLI